MSPGKAPGDGLAPIPLYCWGTWGHSCWQHRQAVLSSFLTSMARFAEQGCSKGEVGENVGNEHSTPLPQGCSALWGLWWAFRHLISFWSPNYLVNKIQSIRNTRETRFREREWLAQGNTAYERLHHLTTCASRTNCTHFHVVYQG